MILRLRRSHLLEQQAAYSSERKPEGRAELKARSLRRARVRLSTHLVENAGSRVPYGQP